MFAPFMRIETMPAKKSCTAPMKTQPTGMMRSATLPNLMPRMTPMTGPTPAMFRSWMSMFFHFGSGT